MVLDHPLYIEGAFSATVPDLSCVTTPTTPLSFGGLLGGL